MAGVELGRLGRVGADARDDAGVGEVGAFYELGQCVYVSCVLLSALCLCCVLHAVLCGWCSHHSFACHCRQSASVTYE